MEVQDIMTKEFEIVSSNDNILQAAKRMKALNVGILPVKDGNKITGIVTDRDIVIRALAENKEPKNVKIKDIMSPKIASCSADDSIEEAASIMKEKQVRRLIVLDNQNMPVGILSLGDIAAKSKLDLLAGETLDAISQPSRPWR
jgi:CBS domain-containing protein